MVWECVWCKRGFCKKKSSTNPPLPLPLPHALDGPIHECGECGEWKVIWVCVCHQDRQRRAEWRAAHTAAGGGSRRAAPSAKTDSGGRSRGTCARVCGDSRRCNRSSMYRPLCAWCGLHGGDSYQSTAGGRPGPEGQSTSQRADQSTNVQPVVVTR